MKRIWIGSLLILAGIVVALLPLHIAMTGLCLMGYGVLCLADWLFEKKGWKRGWRTAVKVIGIGVFVVLAAAMTFIGLEGRSQWDEAREADYAVVPGRADPRYGPVENAPGAAGCGDGIPGGES